jgi:shikimate kinase
VAELALALAGFMASGKTTVGRLVADRAGAAHHDLDAIIEQGCGMPAATYLRTRGEPAFRSLEAELLPGALEPGSVVSLGGGTPVSDANWEIIQERALTVWLDASLAEVTTRTDPSSRPMLDGRGPECIRELFESRLARYAQCDYRVDAAQPLESVVEEVLRLWHG